MILQIVPQMKYQYKLTTSNTNIRNQKGLLDTKNLNYSPRTTKKKTFKKFTFDETTFRKLQETQPSAQYHAGYIFKIAKPVCLTDCLSKK